MTEPNARAAKAIAEQALRRAAAAESANDQLLLAVQRVETQYAEILKRLGSQDVDEHGQDIGTGIVGRLMRLETEVRHRFRLYDGWVKLAAGFCAAVVIAGGVIWWLVSGQVSRVLRH